MANSGIDGFSTQRIDVDGVALAVHRGGHGKPLILLHGYPQTHLAWGKVAPVFARTRTVIAPDLRGYGASDAPPDDPQHLTYSKRRMALDVVGIMDALGIDRADVLGHDRGGRVAYRMALDHPDRVARLGLIEIVPTVEFWDAWSADLALKAYHWTFLAQPSPLPERMILSDPAGYVDWTLAAWTLDKSLGPFDAAALAAYRAQAGDPARVAAMCADYRAGASIDRRLDAEDRTAGRKIAAPLRFLWAEGGFPAQTGDPAGIWRRWADQVSDVACRSGHFPMEENPDAVVGAFDGFFD